MYILFCTFLLAMPFRFINFMAFVFHKVNGTSLKHMYIYHKNFH